MQFNKILILLALLISSSAIFSQKDEKHTLFEHKNYSFPYNINNPDKEWELPKKLVEISGLTFIDKKRIACVQDEKGNIYIFNLKIGEVERKVDFGDNGDYEGVEIIGNDAWILKSNGTLYQVTDFLKDVEPPVNKHSTALSGKNDAEGLAYDPISQNLLIACKGHPFVDEKAGKEFKAIYTYNLMTKQIEVRPFLLIAMDSIKFYKNYNTMTELGVELLAYFDHSKGDLSFQPSGISIHPHSGNIYILGSVGNLLLVFSREGDMLAIIDLKSKIHKQPEGICFDPDGTLYISNEGDETDGTILMFESKK